MTTLRWSLGVVWAMLFAVGGYHVEQRRMAAEKEEDVRRVRPSASTCDAVAMRPMAAGYRLAEQDAANAAGPATKLAGKYAARDLARGDRICDSDLLAVPRISMASGFSAGVIANTPIVLNAGATVDLAGKTFVLNGVRVAAVLCSPACNQAIVEVPAANVKGFLEDKEVRVAMIRTLP